MTPPRAPKVPYGGDCDPEQWPEEAWGEDHPLFTRTRIDTLTVGVFPWSIVRPAEDTHDFTALDRVLDRAAAEDRRVCPATGTAALAGEGVPRGRPHRLRGPPAPLRPAPRLPPRLSTAPAGRLAERYAGHPGLETATRIAPDGTRLLFLLNHAPGPARLTAPAPAVDLLTGRDEPFTLDPLGVAVLRLQWTVRPRASGTPDLRRK
ncbi:hypothetical protein GCM10019016_036270 [Streptomyces prasinosporus]|uniref:DUF3459 domain-containing protein n=1 Tax=Streptomyces prasinosporus TaxID=68256 RepID=A0ABP6TQZ7_9ACTN